MTSFEPPSDPGPATADLREQLADPSVVIVDVRPMAAYNGWRLHGEARGGHIPGAVAFPRTWLSNFADAEVARVLRKKGVTTHRTIVVYGDREDDAVDLVATLARLGFEHVRLCR
jgi:molybdopterin synthase sulfurtransferase